MPTSGGAPSVATVLNPDGSLRPGAAGSFDATGYALGYGPDGQPLLRPTAAGWNVMSGSSAGLQNGVNGTVYALAVSGTDVYVGGSFSQAGGLAANNVAKWDGTSWSSLGTGTANGVSAIVYTLALAGTDLYVGGRFSQAGTVTTNNVAKWDGTNWSSLGSGTANGVVGNVFALVVSGANVYVGGDFFQAGGMAISNLAKWDGTSWSPLGTGVNNAVQTLALDGSGNVYVGGAFTQAGGATANRVAKWDGTSWSSLGTGTANGVSSNVGALTVSGTNVYVGGNFTQAGGMAISYLAKWNGTSWSSVGYIGGGVSFLASSGSNVYVTGNFTEAGGVTANGVAKWDGTSWSSLGTGTANGIAGGGIYNVAVNGSDVYVGGSFTQAGGATANGMAKYNGTTWSPLGTGGPNGVNSIINAMAGNGPDVYVGGSFSQAAGVTVNRVAKWNSTGWSPLGAGFASGTIYALAVSGSNVYVGGTFSQAGGIAANNVARWDGTSWSPLGAGISGVVRALAISGSDLYVGGNFAQAGSTAASNVARWDGTNWSPLGTGIPVGANVNTLAVSGSDVYVGGSFSQAGGIAANNVARWDGTSWNSLGTGTANGVDYAIYALAVSGPNVYVGGSITRAGGVAVNSIAQWNGTAWSALGNGISGSVSALATNGTDVYVGGSFSQAGSITAKNVAKWNGTSWSSLGLGTANGVDNLVRALAVSGTDLYVAGNFSTAGGQVANNVAYYSATAPGTTLTGFTPTSGPVGTSVVLTGTSLTGASVVTLNGTAGSFTVDSDTQITLLVPAGASSGTITVTTPSGMATSSQSFTVTLPNLTVNTTSQLLSGSYNNITITNTGAATLSGALSVAGQLLVQAGGSLNTNCQLITGTGSFTAAAGSTLYVCDPAGLSASGSAGAVQVSGTRRYSSAATYVYNGTAAQSTGTGLPARLCNLTVQNANAVTLSQPLSLRGLLTLAGAGNLVLNGQALTLLSDADTTAAVLNTGAGVVSGPVTVQRYVGRTVNAGLGYRHLSAPVGNTTVADLATTGFTPVVNPSYNTSATPGTVTPFPTVFGYDEARLNTSPATTLAAFDKGWFSPAATSDAMLVGRGYTVNLAGGQTVDFVGTLTTGNVPLTLPRTNAADGGWQLLGNPYPSVLDWSQVTIPAGLGGALYVYQSTSPYSGSYRNYINGVGNPLIGLGQGFFVRTSPGSSSATLTLTNQARTAAVLTAEAPVNRIRPETRPLVQLTLQGLGLADEAYVYFQAGAPAADDAAFDAPKLRNPHGLDLASVGADPAGLAINGLPLATAPTTVPLQLHLPQAGSYTLTAAQQLNFTAGDVQLLDALTGQQINLSQQPAYTFTAPAGLLTGRFSLQVGARVTASHPAALAAATSLYPNPAHTRATLALPAGTRAAAVTVHNALGQVVQQPPATGPTLELDLRGLRAGVYSVRVQLGDATVTKRLVVE